MNTITMMQSVKVKTKPDIVEIKWGDICYVDFGQNFGSEQNGIRPALIIQNDKGNTYSSTTIVASITSQDKRYLPTHVIIHPQESGLNKVSTVMFEQIRTIDKKRIISKVGHIDASLLIESLRKSLTISFGML